MELMASTRALYKKLINKEGPGKIPNSRMFQGRQLYFLNSQQGMFLLPYVPQSGTEGMLQIVDPSSTDYGLDYVLADMHPADGTDAVIP